MSTPTPSLPTSKPTPGRTGAQAALTPSASSPNIPTQLSKAGKSPHKGGPSTTNTPLGASSPGLDVLYGLNRARASTGANSKNTPGSIGTPQAGLGLGLVRNEEPTGRSQEAVQAKLRTIFQLLSQRWGRVSQDGLTALVPRLGLDGMWEDGMGSGAGSGVMKGKQRNYIIAGKGFSVEVEWQGEKVAGVVLDLTRKTEEQTEGLRRAGEILRKDLVGWNDEMEKGLYVHLDGFAANLERLACLDRLSVEEKASCFEALDGVYHSLQQLYKWEHDKVQEKKFSEAKTNMEVLCQRGGRPALHEGRKIGHRIDYWFSRRAAAYNAPDTSVKRSPESSTLPLPFSSEDTVSSLLLTCQPGPANPFLSIRVTSNWANISETKEMDSTTLPQWEDPKPIALHEDDDPMDIDVTIAQSLRGSHPSVRFAARLEPPVILPYQVVVEICQLVGTELTPEQPRSYLSLLFQDHPALVGREHMPGEFPLSFRRVPGHETTRNRYNVFSSDDLFGKVLEEIPFFHPNQLWAIIPYLRQWVFVGDVLKRTAGLLDPKPTKIDEQTKQKPKHIDWDDDQSIPSDTDSDSDSDSEPPKVETSEGIPMLDIPTSTKKFKEGPEMDITLSYSAATRRVDIDASPLFKQDRLLFRVSGNAKVEVEVRDNVNGKGKDHGQQDEVKAQIFRALALTEDLGLVQGHMSRA